MARRKIKQLKKNSLGELGNYLQAKIYEGFGIQDLSKIKLALGDKILWRIVTVKRMWWKEIMQKKYLNGTRKRCVENVNHDRKGYLICELCKKPTFILNERLYWIPSNGKKINIWKDKIGNACPTNFLQAFSEL